MCPQFSDIELPWRVVKYASKYVVGSSNPGRWGGPSRAFHFLRGETLPDSVLDFVYYICPAETYCRH